MESSGQSVEVADYFFEVVRSRIHLKSKFPGEGSLCGIIWAESANVFPVLGSTHLRVST